jgi:hypothetical protein
MFNLFQNIHIDWLGKRKIFIGFSIFIMLAGLFSRRSVDKRRRAARRRLTSVLISRAERWSRLSFAPGQRMTICERH